LQTDDQIQMPAGDLIDRVRLQMRERGFGLVTTPPVFGDGALPKSKNGRMVLRADSKGWWKLPQLAVYCRWLEGLLSEALPEESLGLTELELRHEPAGAEDKEVDRLHADGSYLRSIYTLYGPTTIYREGKVDHSVPSGQTLLMTAMARARAMRVRCTLHRRPGAGPERAVIVCSFEPGVKQANPPYQAKSQRLRSIERKNKTRRAAVVSQPPRLACCPLRNSLAQAFQI
jgi:hypothetical protein